MGSITQPQTQNCPDKIDWTVVRVHVMDTQIILVSRVYWHMPISTVQIIDHHVTERKEQ